MADNILIFQYGNINDNPIVFIHGFPFDNYMWKYQVEHFSKSNYCITYDIRGLGKSPAGDGQYTIEMMVDDLEDVIEHSNIKKPVICGLSMGGYIALRAVERNETLYKGVILCDTKSEADDNTAKLKRSDTIKRINNEGVQKFAEQFVASLFAPGSAEKLGEEYINIIGRSINSDPAGVKGCLLAMASRMDTTDDLSKINIPSLVICGDQDPLIPPGQMEKLSGRIKNSRFAVIRDSGHLAPFEQPEKVNRTIAAFLNEIE